MSWRPSQSPSSKLPLRSVRLPQEAPHHGQQCGVCSAFATGGLHQCRTAAVTGAQPGGVCYRGTSRRLAGRCPCYRSTAPALPPGGALLQVDQQVPGLHCQPPRPAGAIAAGAPHAGAPHRRCRRRAAWWRLLKGRQKAPAKGGRPVPLLQEHRTPVRSLVALCYRGTKRRLLEAGRCPCYKSTARRCAAWWRSATGGPTGGPTGPVGACGITLAVLNIVGQIDDAAQRIISAGWII